MHRRASPISVRCPTPILEARTLPGRRGHLWIKNDGLSHPKYGGNKVRKLEPVLERAEASGAKRLVTLGAGGSHHVLATTLFGRQNGFAVKAALWPQPRSPHAEATLRAAIKSGLEWVPASSPAGAVAQAFRNRRPGDFFIPVGGLGLRAVRTYMAALTELKQQIESKLLPEPDVIVVPVGTGTTAAGLLAGCLLHKLSTRIVGVLVAPNPVARAWIVTLALGALREMGGPSPLALRRQLEVDPRQIGRGYGFPTEAGEAAEPIGQRAGLRLDPTYTAKAFARALREIGYPGFSPDFEKVRLARPRHVLYWHTLSAAPLLPLLDGAPPLPEQASRLFF